MNTSNYIVLEKSGEGNLFPVGSVLDINGEPVFWRDFSNNRFLFRKGNYTAIYQDEAVIKYLVTTPVQQLYFRDTRSDTIYRTSIDTYKNAKIVTMCGRKQRGASLVRFEVAEDVKTPDSTRPKNSVVIEA